MIRAATRRRWRFYRFLPNDTDLSPVLDAGRPGMNAAFIEGAYQYHTPGDVPANLSPASVQNHGGNALALTRAPGGAGSRAAGSRRLRRARHR